MKLRSLEHTKAFLSTFVSNTIFSGTSNDHLSAIHEIEQHILKLRYVSIFIFEDVNIDLIVCRNLESLIASHEENISSHVFYLINLFPSPYKFSSFCLLRFLLNLNFTE
jgi:hypothetical protein